MKKDAQLKQELADLLLGERIPLDITTVSPMSIGLFPSVEIIIPANKKITTALINKLVKNKDNWETDPSPIRNRLRQIFEN